MEGDAGARNFEMHSRVDIEGGRFRNAVAGIRDGQSEPAGLDRDVLWREPEIARPDLDVGRGGIDGPVRRRDAEREPSAPVIPASP